MSLRTARHASSPFMVGMVTSRTMTSGFSLAAFSTASAPSAASPTISHSLCPSRMVFNPCLTIGWSSTSKMRIVICSYWNERETTRQSAAFWLEPLRDSRSMPAEETTELQAPRPDYRSLAERPIQEILYSELSAASVVRCFLRRERREEVCLAAQESEASREAPKDRRLRADH